MHERDAIFQLWQQNPNAVLATVVEVRGSAYRRPGARMLLCENGDSCGVINGGCLDADLWRRAREVMNSGRAQLAVYDSTAPEDILWGLGLGCRGVVKILVEPARDLSWLRDESRVAVFYENGELGTRLWDGEIERPNIVETAMGRAFVERLEAPQSLLIFGAGADAVPLWEMAQILGWKTDVLDPRPPHPERVNYLAAQHFAPENLHQISIPPRVACVVMTHNFLHDLEILKAVLPSNAFYVGILGPKSRTDDLLARLNQNTLLPAFSPTPEQLQKLHAPVGLDLGAETPEEIALSIVAEIQKLRRAKTGQSLRERDAIH